MSSKSVTISDVAERAQVSKVAVSVALHGSRNSTRMAPATRQRILQAAQDLHYTPNGLARALRARRMNVIGLYLGDKFVDVRGLFMAETVSGTQVGCDEHRKDMLIHGSFRGKSVDDIYAELLGGKIDGLVMLAKIDDPLVLRLSNSALPAVAIADAVPNLPSVVVDDRGGSILVAQFLAQRGHRRVLYRKGPMDQTSTVRRHAAFLEAAAAQGIAVDEDIGPVPSPDAPLSLWEQSLMMGGSKLRPTAVACGTDRVAFATIRSCRSLGLRVPKDVAVVGFDGMVSEIPPAIQLTTIKAPWSEVARIAVDLVVRRLEGEELAMETVLPIEFVMGETA